MKDISAGTSRGPMVPAPSPPRSGPRSGGFLDSLREGFAFVAAQAGHVRIDASRVATYAASLPERAPANVLDPAYHYIGGREETAAFIFILDAINFGSGYKPLLREEGLELVHGSIYLTVASRLKDYFTRHGSPSAAALQTMQPRDVGGMLGFDAEKPHGAAFAALCCRSLHDLGAYIERDHAGRFLGPVETAGGSAETFVARLAQIPSYHDAHMYKGREIGFYKRAQITAADLQLAFRHFGEELFSDTEKLTMFADNAVPHVLRVDGMTAYDAPLAARIDGFQSLPSGSEEEIEIRGCAAHLVELVAAQKNLPPMSVDHILWHRSVEDARYKQKPSHKTLTLNY